MHPGKDSQMRRVAVPIIETLAKRYEITRYSLTKMPKVPITPETYAERVAGKMPRVFRSDLAFLCSGRIMFFIPLYVADYLC